MSPEPPAIPEPGLGVAWSPGWEHRSRPETRPSPSAADAVGNGRCERGGQSARSPVPPGGWGNESGGDGGNSRWSFKNIRSGTFTLKKNFFQKGKQRPRSLPRGACPRHRCPRPANGPRLTEPRGPAAPPRPRCAPLAAPCLPSAGAGPAALASSASSSSSPSTARDASLAPGRPGQPRGLGRAAPAPAPHPASPPVRLGGGDAGLPAAASQSPPPTRTTLARPGGVGPDPRSSG